MTQYPVLYLMTGLLFGTTLLAAGIALGFWMGRKSGNIIDLNSEDSRLDSQKFLSVVRSIAAWTNDVAGDVSQYQSQMHRLALEAQQNSHGNNPEALRPILDQIVSANEHLQMRLEAAEKKLETQTNQLEGYLAEARTDALTGLANRRAFDQRMDDLHAKHHRTNQPFTLALIDVDHFKNINDTLGHDIGDSVLKHVASLLAGFSDNCNLIARYGGEEFAMLFTAPREQAAAIVDKLRAHIAATPFVDGDAATPATVSCGIAQLAPGERIGELFRHSDEALYAAKQSGRNRVVVHDGRSCASLGKPALMKTETSPLAIQAPLASKRARAAPSDSPSGAAGLQNSDALEKRVLEHLDQLVEEESLRNL